MINIKNKVQLVGPVSGIQTYETENGTQYSLFTISTIELSTTVVRVGQSVQIKHACIAFNKQARFVRDFLSEGNEIAIEGRLIHLPKANVINSTDEVLVEINEVLKLH